MPDVIEPTSRMWYAERRKDGTFNLYFRQEDGTYGLYDNGLVLEDILKRLGDENAIWTGKLGLLHITQA